MPDQPEEWAAYVRAVGGFRRNRMETFRAICKNYYYRREFEHLGNRARPPRLCPGCWREAARRKAADDRARKRRWDPAVQQLLTNRACATCELPLPADARLDARYCGSICRQRAYRRRLAAA
jgi:hypothetical protein